MSTLTSSNIENFMILCAFLIIVCSIISGHVIHVPTPQVFKSRLKGQVACYSCLSLLNDSNSLQLSDNNFKFNITIIDLYQTLEKGGMLISKDMAKCVETYYADFPNYHQMDLVFCSNTAIEPGACVKLIGNYYGEQYVYRNCWNNMWIEKRPYAQQMSERCYDDELVQNFVATNDNKICFCEDDLCNSSDSILLLSLFNDLCFIIIFIIFLYFKNIINISMK